VFLSRFCTSDTEFDVVSFMKAVDEIVLQKPACMMDAVLDGTISVPEKSVYFSLYPDQQIQSQKLHEQKLVQTTIKNDMDDLSVQVELT
jgi:hypothetical protein